MFVLLQGSLRHERSPLKYCSTLPSCSTAAQSEDDFDIEEFAPNLFAAVREAYRSGPDEE